MSRPVVMYKRRRAIMPRRAKRGRRQHCSSSLSLWCDLPDDLLRDVLQAPRPGRPPPLRRRVPSMASRRAFALPAPRRPVARGPWPLSQPPRRRHPPRLQPPRRRHRRRLPGLVRQLAGDGAHVVASSLPALPPQPFHHGDREAADVDQPRDHHQGRHVRIPRRRRRRRRRRHHGGCDRPRRPDRGSWRG